MTSERTMIDSRPLLRLDDDNFGDFFDFEHLDELLAGVEPPADGFDPHGPEANRLLAWVSERNREPLEYRFELSRHDAAVILNVAVGWDPLAADPATILGPRRNGSPAPLRHDSHGRGEAVPAE